MHTEFSMEKLQKKTPTLKAENGRMFWHNFLLENMLYRQDVHGKRSEMCPTGDFTTGSETEGSKTKFI